jgi:hypothetical protein
MDVKVIVPHILHGANSIVARSEALAKPDALESAGRGLENSVPRSILRVAGRS